jgi:integrase
LRASTVALRQAHCRWAASALVACGVPIDTITSLSILVAGQNPNRILRFLYERGGCKPNAALSHVGEVLRIIAKYHVKLPQKEVNRIRSLANRHPLKYKQMTLKNERTVRAAMRPETVEVLLALPDALMKAAWKLHNVNPARAASLALRAVLIKFLLHIPLRLENIRTLRFDKHLHRADPARGLITGILISEDETKTEDQIVASVAPELGAMMEAWIRHFRPSNAADGCPYLFAGHGTGMNPMCPQALRDAVRQTTLRYLGVAITPHQFRHLAAKRYLRAYPGHYEAVRQMLGHKSVETTRRSYAGSDLDATMARHDALLTTDALDVRRQSEGQRRKPRQSSRHGGDTA